MARVGRAIGRQGRLTAGAGTPTLTGDSADTSSALDTLINDLVHPTTEVARVIDAVAEAAICRRRCS